MKARVYFCQDFHRLTEATKKVLSGFYPRNSQILVKLHFGEPGNPTAFTPKDIQPIVKALKDLDLEVTLIDTPVAYHSPRNTLEGYQKVVRERGYHKLAKVVISEKSKAVKVKDFTALVCRELLEAKNVLVISHVKGHLCAGFGGAIKNFGMGGLMIASKRTIHDFCKPKFVKKCRGCGTCARLCPFGAITMVRQEAQINLKKCAGCSICQLNCPYQVLAPKKAFFDDLLAQGAAAVINHLQKAYYINIIKNVTRKCDCDRKGSELISPDAGVLFSENPVAIDKASVELIKKINQGKDVFLAFNHKDPHLQIQYCAKYTHKSPAYSLKKINL